MEAAKALCADGQGTAHPILEKQDASHEHPPVLGASVLAALALACLIAIGCGDRRHAADVTLDVFAAASLADLISELSQLSTAQGGAPVRLNVASSGALARQIQASETADVFLSADVIWLEALGDLAPADARRVLWTNELVLVRRGDAGAQPAQDVAAAVLAARRLALGDPMSVPAGRYARQALAALPDPNNRSATLWQRLGPRLVPTSDVRAALALAAADERTAAIVYRTDLVADRSGRLRVEASLPMPTDVSIELVGAALRGGQVTEARAYLEFLSSPTAAAVARRHGFGVTGSDA